MTTTADSPTTQGSVAAPTYLPMMQPVLRRGRSFLDRAMMPGDENELRVQALLAAAAERGLDGVVIFGAAHLPENLGYYANYTPTTFYGALVARTGEQPVLFAGKGGARDHPYIRTVSWVNDIRYASPIGPAVVEVANSWRSPWSRLGVAGLDNTLPHEVRDDVVAALGDRSESVDDIVAEHRREKSARELAVLGTAHDIAQRAAAAAVTAYDQGAGRRAALAAADFSARAGDAHDCRITARTETGGIAAMSEVRDQRGPLSAVVAVEYLGYWGMAAIQPDLTGDAAGLPRTVVRLRPGRTLRRAGIRRRHRVVPGQRLRVRARRGAVRQRRRPVRSLSNDVLSIVHLGSVRRTRRRRAHCRDRRDRRPGSAMNSVTGHPTTRSSPAPDRIAVPVAAVIARRSRRGAGGSPARLADTAFATLVGNHTGPACGRSGRRPLRRRFARRARVPAGGRVPDDRDRRCRSGFMYDAGLDRRAGCAHGPVRPAPTPRRRSKRCWTPSCTGTRSRSASAKRSEVPSGSPPVSGRRWP